MMNAKKTQNASMGTNIKLIILSAFRIGFEKLALIYSTLDDYIQDRDLFYKKNLARGEVFLILF